MRVLDGVNCIHRENACVHTVLVNIGGPPGALLARAAAEVGARLLSRHGRETRAHAHVHGRASEGERAAKEHRHFQESVGEKLVVVRPAAQRLNHWLDALDWSRVFCKL